MGILSTAKIGLDSITSSSLYRSIADSDETTAKAINVVLDAVNSDESIALVFDTAMITVNEAAVYKNNHGSVGMRKNTTRSLINAVFTNADATFSTLAGAFLGPTARSTTHKMFSHLSTAVNRTIDNWEQALVQPNIAGVPISAKSVTTSREVDISESMVISQSSGSKLYMTDNAVPRLKEWEISGYLTSSSILDAGFLIKPSLVWQLYYLDVCAKSRRPVMFKTNKGEFVKVQITNLNTSEDASYNNCVEVSITLKEYNPYVAETATSKRLLGILQ